MSVSSAITLPPTALLDDAGEIVEVNHAWDAFGDRNGLPERYTSVGKNYLTVTQQADDEYADRVAIELRHLLGGEQTEFTVVYPCHAPKEERWFRLYATAVSFREDGHFLLVHQRLDRQPPATDSSVTGAPNPPDTASGSSDRSRLVTYSLSADETLAEGLLMAFDAIGIDIQNQDTVLEDWIDTDMLAALQTSPADYHITFSAWEHLVALTPGETIVYTRDSGPG